MQIIETPVYTFDELSDAAKEKARDWYREGAFDFEWWDAIYDDAVECASRLGIAISTSTETYSIIGQPGAKSRQRTDIQFTGFWSQGDGACFEGTYTPKADAVAAIKEHADDERLVAIATQLEAALAKCGGNLISVAISHNRGAHYCHEFTMDYEFEWTDEESGNQEVEAEFIDAFRAFAKWIYRQLESEYEYQSADEQVDDSIRANEYTFTENGKRFG